MTKDNIFIDSFTTSVKNKNLGLFGTGGYKISISSILISILAFMIILSSLSIIFFGSYTSRINVQGHISPNGDIINIYGNISGIVKSINVHNGDEVNKGAALLSITNSQLNTNNSPYELQRENLINRLNLVKRKIKITKSHFIKKSQHIKNEKYFYEKILNSTIDMVNASNKKNNITKENLGRLEKLFYKNSIAKKTAAG